jgi:hypothetical protein
MTWVQKKLNDDGSIGCVQMSHALVRSLTNVERISKTLVARHLQ